MNANSASCYLKGGAKSQEAKDSRRFLLKLVFFHRCGLLSFLLLFFFLFFCYEMCTMISPGLTGQRITAFSI